MCALLSTLLQTQTFAICINANHFWMHRSCESLQNLHIIPHSLASPAMEQREKIARQLSASTLDRHIYAPFGLELHSTRSIAARLSLPLHSPSFSTRGNFEFHAIDCTNYSWFFTVIVKESELCSMRTRLTFDWGPRWPPDRETVNNARLDWSRAGMCVV